MECFHRNQKKKTRKKKNNNKQRDIISFLPISYYMNEQLDRHKHIHFQHHNNV